MTFIYMFIISFMQMSQADPETISDPEDAQLNENEVLKCRDCDF